MAGRGARCMGSGWKKGRSVRVRSPRPPRLWVEGLEPRTLLAGDLGLGDLALGDLALGDVSLGDLALGNGPRSAIAAGDGFESAVHRNPNVSPGQNSDWPLDVNADGLVTPRDFLAVVNAIHERDGAGAERGMAERGMAGRGGGVTYPDINGDQVVTALDALILANWFHRGWAADDPRRGDSPPQNPPESLPGDLPSHDPFAAVVSGEPGIDQPGIDQPGIDQGKTFAVLGAESLRSLTGADRHRSVGGLARSAPDAEGEQPVCDSDTLTVSLPEKVQEYEVFTVSGVAKHAEELQVRSTGLFAYVDLLVEATSFFDRRSGAFAIMLIYLDDAAKQTSVDRETVTVISSGGCSASFTAEIAVHNVEVGASVSLSPTVIQEGEAVRLNVKLTDAIADGQTVVIEWGDGQTTTRTLPEVDAPYGVTHRRTFGDPPQSFAWEETFVHEYLDDNPSLTPQDQYEITVTVTDDDASLVKKVMRVTVNNVDPVVTIDKLTFLDEQIPNGRVDEGESFHVEGTVRDQGLLDSQHGVVRVDLNADGDFFDLGEEIQIGGGGGSWKFSARLTVPDDGPSPGNTTSFDSLSIQVRVHDDDTGKSEVSQTIVVHNVPPRIDWDALKVTYTRDSLGNIDTVTVAGTFQDPGQEDVHELGIRWPDQETGTTFPVTGRSFKQTRTFPPSFGTSIHRAFPVVLGIRDDDSGVDRGRISVETYWAFDGLAKVRQVKDLAPKEIQPLVSPAHKGAQWKGYGEVTIEEVGEGSNIVTGSALAGSAISFGSLLASADFSEELDFQASSRLTFAITCDRQSGMISHSYSGGGGGGLMRLSPDGKFLGWDESQNNQLRNGPMVATTNVAIAIEKGNGENRVAITPRAEFGYSTGVTITKESGPQWEGPGGKILEKYGTSSNYVSGLYDHEVTSMSVVCRERVKVLVEDLED